MYLLTYQNLLQVYIDLIPLRYRITILARLYFWQSRALQAGPQ